MIMRELVTFSTKIVPSMLTKWRATTTSMFCYLQTIDILICEKSRMRAEQNINHIPIKLPRSWLKNVASKMNPRNKAA